VNSAEEVHFVSWWKTDAPGEKWVPRAIALWFGAGSKRAFAQSEVMDLF